jgi:DNA-binding GntR family transcriptional regulator
MTLPASEPGSLRVGRVAAPLREQVTAVLREAILDFRLRPGQRLVERELIEQTGVSRATIREVLRQLTAEGLVTVIPQRGAIVVELTRREVENVYEVRATMESLAVRLFTERATDEQVVKLREAVEEMRAVFEDADQPATALLDAKDRYHAVYLEGCGNEEIGAILSGLQARVRLMRATSLGQPGRAAQALAEVEEVAAAIERRDPDAAEAAAMRHVRSAAENGLRGMAKAQVGDDEAA